MIFGRAAVAAATPYESGGWVQLSQLDELTVICHDEFLEISINWRWTVYCVAKPNFCPEDPYEATALQRIRICPCKSAP